MPWRPCWHALKRRIYQITNNVARPVFRPLMEMKFAHIPENVNLHYYGVKSNTKEWFWKLTTHLEILERSVNYKHYVQVKLKTVRIEMRNGFFALTPTNTS